MKRARYTVLFLTALITVATSSYAQNQGPMQTPAESEAMTDKARELYMEGRTMYGQQQWDRAHASFLAAWSLKKHWQIAGMLGLCEVHMQRYRDAAEHLSFAVRTGAVHAAPDEMKSLQESLQESMQHVGTVNIQVDVEGAELLVNGRTVGTSPLFDPLFLNPGSHVLQARSINRVSSDVRLDIVAGSKKEIVLRVDQESGSSGVADSSVRGEGGTEDVRQDRSLLPILFVSAGTVFVAGAVVGGVYGGKASSDADEVNDLRGSLPPAGCNDPANAVACARLAETRDSYDRNVKRRNVALAVGGVGLVAAGVTGYLWWNDKKSTQHAITVLPFSDGMSTGLSATGHF